MEIRNLNTFLQVVSIKNFGLLTVQCQCPDSAAGTGSRRAAVQSHWAADYPDPVRRRARPIRAEDRIDGIAYGKFFKIKGSIGRYGSDRDGRILFEPAVLQYHQTYPHVKVDLIVDDTATLKEGMQMGILDFACLIAEPLPKTQWQTWYAKNESVVVIGHPDNPLSKRKSLQLADLKDEEFILMELTAPYIVHFQSIIAGQNITLHPFLTLQSADTATRLVSKGDFVSVLPLYTVRHAAGKGQVVILPVTDFQGSQYVQMVLHANKVMTPQIEGFLQEIRTVIETGQSGL